MTPHPVEEMRSFKSDAYKCSFFGKDRDSLHALLSIRPWAGKLLCRFYPARCGSVEGLYEIEWPRKFEQLERPAPRVVYFNMGHRFGRGLPILLLSAREEAVALPMSVLHRVAALGRRAHTCLSLETSNGV